MPQVRGGRLPTRVRRLVTSAVVASLSVASLVAAHPAQAAGTARVVTFAGVRVSVPVEWPVFDFTQQPDGCARFDQHAVYLGVPTTSTCPPHLVGHTEAVQITAEPEPTTAADTRTLPKGFTESGGSETNPDLVISSSSARVTVSGNAGSQVQADIAASVTADPGYVAPAGPHRRSYAASTSARPAPRGSYATVEGFDACSAPSLTTMKAWLQSSPYRAVGVYVGGSVRACGQPNLTSSWVSSVTNDGWNLIPIYVGRQAPCWGGSAAKVDPSTAAAQGRQSADDAVAQMQSLGMGAGNPVYYDMEAYDAGNSACVTAVETYLDAWTVELHAVNYFSGVYGSTGSLVKNMVEEINNSAYHLPDNLWIAHYDNSGTTSDPTVPDNAWSPHQRIKQDRGGHQETYGGVTINIDHDVVDGAVVGNGTIPQGPAQPDTTPPAGQVTAPASGSTVPFLATITVSGVFSDDQSVTSVDFLVSTDAVNWRTIGTDTHTGFGTYQVSWMVNENQGTNLHFTARPHDAAGNTGTDTVTGTDNITVVAPDTTPPTVSMVAPTSSFTTSTYVDVSWTGADSGSGLATFDARYERASYDGDFRGWAYPSSWQGTFERTMQSPALIGGYNYCFEVRARDNSGNVSEWSSPKCVAGVLAQTALKPSVGWIDSYGSGYFHGSAKSTNRIKASLSLANTRVDRVGILASMCSGCGKVDIYIDGSPIGTIDLYSPTTKHQQLLELPAFGYTSGTVMVRSLTRDKTIRINGLALSAT